MKPSPAKPQTDPIFVRPAIAGVKKTIVHAAQSIDVVDSLGTPATAARLIAPSQIPNTEATPEKRTSAL